MFPRRIGTRSGKKIKFRTKSSSSSKKRMPRKTINTIDVDEELNTQTFDEYQRAVWKMIPSNKREGCICFDPLWYNSYVRNKENARNNVMYWISIESVFDKRYVFIPLCQANHWNLVILCNLGHTLKSRTSPCILLLDSLHAADPQHLEADIRRFVIDIYKNEDKDGYDDIQFKVPKVPQQKDATKCGHYVLYYMYKFIMACPEHFNSEEDYPGFMDESWFTESDIKAFFETIASVSNEEIEHKDKEEDNAAETDVSKKADSEKHFKGDDLFEGSDALRALVIYTPESSQPQSSPEMFKPVPPAPETNNEAKKEASVSFITQSDFGKKAPRRLTIKLREKRTSPRLSATKAHRNDPAPKSSVDNADTVDAAFDEHDNIEVSKMKKRNKEVQGQTTAAYDDDNDFEKKPPKKAKGTDGDKKDNTSRQKKRKTQVKESNKKGKKAKKAGETTKTNEKPIKVNMRAYPSTFTSVVEGLSAAQKDWIKQAGFGPLLSFSMGGKMFPHFLAVNCLWWFDHTTSEMSLLPNRRIKIKEEDVFDVLVLPRGQLEVSFDGNNDRVADWKKQFPGKLASRITEKEVRQKIEESSVADENFKQNFMVLMVNLFIKSNKTSFVCPKVLKFSGSYDSANAYNWCKPVIENLKDCHENWWVNPHTQFYTGSLIFLLYFYLCRTENRLVTVEKTYPAFLGWLHSRVRDRNRTEMLDNSFGKGEIVEIKDTRKKENFKQNGEKIVERDDEVPLVEQDDEEAVQQEFEDIHVNGDFAKDDEAHNTNLIQHDEENFGKVGEFEIEHRTKEDNVSIQQVVAEVFKDIENEENVHAGILAENEIGHGHDFRTPNETIRGVQKTLIFSQGDELSNSIMSVAREIQFTHDASDNITEKEMLSRVQKDFDELEKLKMICSNKLEKARALFPKNEDFIQYTQQLENMDPFSSTAVEREVEFGENKLRREQKVGEVYKSPFLDRTIDFNRQRLTKEEEEVWKWINGTRQGAMNEIFFWNGTTCYKHHIQSLQLEKRIVFNVVDVYTCILNDNERYRSSNSPRRFFCNTLATMGNVVGGDQNDNSLNFLKFRSNLDSLLHKNKVNICSIELNFFPINYSNHFYVVCFNLKNIGAVLIDNKLRGGDDISIYNGIPEILREMFAEYMAYVNLRRSKMLRSEPIVRLQMKWRTDNNIMDSGVFVMNHMETYMGNALRNWNCRFVAEQHEQKRQLARARQIYAAKIIYSPINYYKDKLLQHIKNECRI